jgi:hypothetical protein
VRKYVFCVFLLSQARLRGTPFVRDHREKLLLLLLLLLLSTHIKIFAKEFEEFFKPVFGLRAPSCKRNWSSGGGRRLSLQAREKLLPQKF